VIRCKLGSLDDCVTFRLVLPCIKLSTNISILFLNEQNYKDYQHHVLHR